MSSLRLAQTSIFPSKEDMKCHMKCHHYLADICMIASVVHGASE